MSVHVEERHLKTAESFVREVHAAGGLAPLDLPRFWDEQANAISEPWASDCPQMPLGIKMSRECIFAELGIPEDWHRLCHDHDFAVRSSIAYNDISERIVGRRLLSEKTEDPTRKWPATKGLHDIFEARNVWHHESYWLMQSADSPDELEALLDRVEARLEAIREFLLPPEWDAEKRRLVELGVPPPLYRGQRGPITFAMSVYGVENLIYLIYDRPELAARFRDLILRSMIALKTVMDEEAGYTPENAPHGFGFADDNCAMLNRDMYEFFGYPILKGIFDLCSPDPGDRRHQHSDSDMGHLLPLLGKLDLNGVNFGPNLTVTEIRQYLPKALIHGQLAPFTFSRNEEVNMVAELLRDFEMARETKGIAFHTAGSINNGSRLSGMRLIMAAIQKFCRYE